MRALNKPELTLLLELVECGVESRMDAVFEHQRMWGDPAIPSRQTQRQQRLDSVEQALVMKILLKALLDGDNNGT